MNVFKILIYIVISAIALILSYLFRGELGVLKGNNKKKYLDYLFKIKNYFKAFDRSLAKYIDVRKTAEPRGIDYLIETGQSNDIDKIRKDIIDKLDFLINDIKKEQSKNLIFNMILNVLFYILGLITSFIL